VTSSFPFVCTTPQCRNNFEYWGPEREKKEAALLAPTFLGEAGKEEMSVAVDFSTSAWLCSLLEGLGWRVGGTNQRVSACLTASLPH
jgi:hypothetical protein